jgi:hypothetical protein
MVFRDFSGVLLDDFVEHIMWKNTWRKPVVLS